MLPAAGARGCPRVQRPPDPGEGYRPGIRILLVEDDPRLADVTARALTADGFVVDCSHDGRQALQAAGAIPYGVLVLDIGLPSLDGVSVCRALRDAGVMTPVLMLTARTGVADRVDGLDAGADDYLGKPFAVEELLARVRALARRGPSRHAPVLQVGGLRLDPAAREASRDGTALDLSRLELALLETFMRHPGQVLSREVLLEHAWEGGSEQRSNVLEVYVRYLRQKVDRPFGVQSIESVRGLGYRLRRDGGA